MATQGHPLLPPIHLEPQYPPGTTEEEKASYQQMMKYQKIGGDFMHYCPTKVVMAGGMGESREVARTAADARCKMEAGVIGPLHWILINPGCPNPQLAKGHTRQSSLTPQASPSEVLSR